MAGFAFTFDPASEDSSNTALDLTNANGYFLLADPAPSFATPELDPLWAYSVDTEGARLASARYENRTIKFTVRCREDSGLSTPVIGAIVQTLQSKTAKLTREGGTLKVTFPSTDVIIFDVLTAVVQVPVGQQYATSKRADCAVTLTCKPFGRGDEVTLDSHTATAGAPLVFTETGIKGDVEAIGSLRLTKADAGAKTWAIWAVQSEHYDVNADLLIEAESGVAVTASAKTGPTGASGTGNNTMFHEDIPAVPQISYELAGLTDDLPHVGIFRVFARVQAPATNTGIVSVRLKWSPTESSTQIENPFVPVSDAAGAAIEGSWVLLDLGLVSIPAVRLGSQSWVGVIWAKATVATDDLYYDWVMLVPVSEGSGLVTTVETVTFTGLIDVSDQGVLTQASGVQTWDPPDKYEGDMLGIPPAGGEGRTLRVLVLLAGESGGNLTRTLVDADDLDADVAQLTYTPRYLVVPA